MIKGCYISLRTTFSADLKKQYYRIKVGKGTSGTGGVFARSGDQGLPVLFSIEYPNAPSRGGLGYQTTEKVKRSKQTFYISSCSSAIYDLEKDLIDIAENVLGKNKKRDAFNLSGQTETFGWFKSRKKALKAAKKIAKRIAKRKPVTLKNNEKITVYDWIKNEEVE
tara:strand:- start:46 stop:543 length:498 start_codon:yes stop_codon:yes gene_type:complete